MKLRTDIMCACVVALSALSSCSSAGDLILRYPYLSQLSNTECLNSRSDGNDDYYRRRTTFEMNISDNTAKCSFKALYYPCDFEKVNVDISYADGILTIVEYPSSDMADCICEVDTSFNIEDLPGSKFLLKVYRGNTDGQYNKDYPILSEIIEVRDGVVIFPYG